MAAPPSPSSTFLVFRSGAQLCALPIEHVLETMRPLPTTAIPEMPSFMLGAAIIRGVTTPVVHMARLIGETTETPTTRFVTVKLGSRVVAFAVDAVLGIRWLDDEVLADVPPLLHAIDGNKVAMVGVLDAELLLVLRSARMVSDAVWAAFDLQALPT